MFNGWAARGWIAGARAAFRPEDNPTTNIMDGKVKFHISYGGLPPAETIDFAIEFDTSYLQALFA
jgi:phage tail sheath protein FI